MSFTRQLKGTLCSIYKWMSAPRIPNVLHTTGCSVNHLPTIRAASNSFEADIPKHCSGSHSMIDDRHSCEWRGGHFLCHMYNCWHHALGQFPSWRGRCRSKRSHLVHIPHFAQIHHLVHTDYFSFCLLFSRQSRNMVDMNTNSVTQKMQCLIEESISLLTNSEREM